MLIFELRGMARDELVALLGSAEQAGGELPADPFGDVAVPGSPAAVVRRLGRFPFWRGTESLTETIDPVYAQASSLGLDVFLGSPEGHSPEPRS